MINELMELSNALTNAGIAPFKWADGFNPLSKNPLVVLCLDENGHVANHKFVAKEDAVNLRKIGANAGTFPSYKFPPIYQCEVEQPDFEIIDNMLANGNVCCQNSDTENGAVQEDLFSLCESKNSVIDREWLKARCATGYNANRKKHVENVRKNAMRLQDLKNAVAIFPEPNDMINEFIRRSELAFKKRDDGLLEFEHSLVDYVFNKISQRDSAASRLLPILVSYKQKGAKKTGEVITFIYFDIAGDFDYPVACEKTMKYINAALLHIVEENAISATGSIVDAFSESATEKDCDDKFPVSATPTILGNIHLRSQMKDKPCQFRYGRAESAAYVLSAGNKTKCKVAMDWIATKENEGCTWQSVGYEQILFVYPRHLESTALAKLPFAKVLAGKSEERFKTAASKLFEAIRQISSEVDTNCELSFFAIKKADTARRQVVFSKACTVRDVEHSCSVWNCGVDSLPTLRFRPFPKKEKGNNKNAAEKQEVELREPYAPAPLSLVDTAFTKWVVNPDLRMCAIGETHLPVFDGYDVFFEPSNKNLVASYLARIVHNAENLFVVSGNTLNSGKSLNDFLSDKLCASIAFVGILLYKLNQGDYMNNSMFLIGQLLKMSDSLHAEYCKQVRGEPPTRLIGNTILQTALSSPAKALAILSQRSVPYLGWAQTFHGEEAGLAKWHLKVIGEISAKLSSMELPSQTDDAMKAKLFLGYLSYIGTDKDKETATNSENNEQE